MPSSFPFPAKAPSIAPPSQWSQDQGVDIAAPGHTPLLAIGSGTIVNHGISGFGQWAPILKLDQPIGGQNYVYYGHAGPGNFLNDGTHVKAGEVIGEVGAGIVGTSTGPHLEIGFSDARGTPVPGTSKLIDQFLHKPSSVGPSLPPGALPPGYHDTQIPNPLDAVSGLASQIISGLFSSIFGGLVAHAEYAAVALVVIVGGFVLMAKGTSRATHAQGAPA